MKITRLAFLAWSDFHARSHFARSTNPEEKWGLLVAITVHKNDSFMSGSSIKVTFEKLVFSIQCLTFVVNAILNLLYMSHTFERKCQQDKPSTVNVGVICFLLFTAD